MHESLTWRQWFRKLLGIHMPPTEERAARQRAREQLLSAMEKVMAEVNRGKHH